MPYRTVSIHVKKLNDNQIATIKALAKESTIVYNQALKLIDEHYKTVKSLPKYTAILKTLKDKNQLDGLGYGLESVVKQSLTAYKVYLSRKSKVDASKNNPSWRQIQEVPRSPKPTRKAYLYSEKFRRSSKDTLLIPIPLNLFKQYGAFKIKLPKRYQELDIKSISISYDRSFTHFQLKVNYFENPKTVQVKHGDYRALAIDIGMTNFATVATSEADSFILDGRHLKSVIQGYEKYTAKAKKAGCKSSKLTKIRKRKDNQLEDYLNKSVAYIINYCLNHRIGYVVIGYNPNFKSNLNLGRKTNQLFFQMPYTRFMEKLQHQCHKHGIKYKRIYEFYTSKSSFLDGDEIPSYLTGEKLTFSGVRRYRGLYVASDGRTINADVNGAANILAKSKLISSKKIELLQSSGFAQPRRIFPLKWAGYN